MLAQGCKHGTHIAHILWKAYEMFFQLEKTSNLINNV
ncbi:hypothetical protein Spb1_17190 [Planctopirus ephydatiae]|uniref:Uncharacterized protein n=1 Tax=Planctopirus ephydatiae TaxID=2528019 RepID=A0A518GMC2_9PLAN|nr:hypothetical protein Spb1_17190 [Planctopirus ephydatiae]